MTPVPPAAAPRAARVRVPASTSNLGAGFDCVGVALDCWLEATATLGTHASPEPRVARASALATLGTLGAADDLLVHGFTAACTAAGRPVPPGLTIDATSDIPVARGLGSSAAAFAAGALLADALLALDLGPHGAAALCATAEGHPDNAAPACLGGAMLGVPNDRRDTSASPWTLVPLPLHSDVAFALAVPHFGTSTAAMRRALPTTLPHRDAVRAASKAAALVHGLATADAALLAWAMDDVLHVPYRRAFVPHYDAVCDAARAAGAWGATLSGAGSSVVALAPSERAPAVAAAMAAAWRRLGVAAEGHTPAVASAAVVEPAVITGGSMSGGATAGDWPRGVIGRQGAPPGTGGSGPASSGVTSSAGSGRANR